MADAVPKVEAENSRRDTSLKHFGLVADMKNGRPGRTTTGS